MITYLYFWILEYFKTENTDIGWQKTRALLATSGILITNLTAVLLFINTIFYKEVNLLNTILIGNRFIDRLIILPVLVSPVFLLVYYTAHKRIDVRIDFFRNEPDEVKRKKRLWVIFYLAISFILISLSIFSPLFINRLPRM